MKSAAERAFAQEVLEKVRRILADLPEDPKLNEIASDGHRERIDIDLGGGLSLVLAIWGKRS